MRKTLTEAMVAKLRAPQQGRLEIHDAIVPGLALRVTPNGAKSFIVRGRIKGRSSPLRITLGDARGIKLADARDEASGILRAFRAGQDPRQERRVRAIEAGRAETLQFEVVVASFIERHAKRNKTWRQTESFFRHYVIPHWKHRTITEITPTDVVSLLDQIEDNCGVYRANRTLAAIRKLMNWAMLRGLIPASPVMRGMARKGEAARSRFLTFEEIRRLWKATSCMGQPFGPFVQFLLITGQRRSEAANARWEAVDLGREKLWTLTEQETKAGREHLVPLSDMAVELLRRQPRINDPRRKEPVYVFTTTGSSPISGFAKAKRKVDIELKKIIENEAKGGSETARPFPTWRLHDLRRTVATHMEDALGIPPHIVGSVLNHAPGAYKGITSVYTRGNLVFERRRALVAWTRLLALAIGSERKTAWRAVARLLQPATEADAARTIEFRRMIQGAEPAWRRYVKGLAP